MAARGCEVSLRPTLHCAWDAFPWYNFDSIYGILCVNLSLQQVVLDFLLEKAAVLFYH
jgi:hypothetical protein